AYSVPLNRGAAGGRTLLEARTIHISDLQAETDEFPEAAGNARRLGSHTMLSVSLIREGAASGAIQLPRTEVRPFTERQVALLQTFADQAVIAIENVRLFKELEARNRDLTEALDRQTATAEILRVISQSQTEVQPVFEAIMDNALRLFRAWSASVLGVEGQVIYLIAMRGGLPGSEEYMRRERSPRSIYSMTPAACCIETRTVVHIQDVESDPTLDQPIRDMARTRGWKSELLAPMLRDG